jgi:hypothetical protein
MNFKKLTLFSFVIVLLGSIFVITPKSVSAASNSCSKIGIVKVVGQQSFRCTKGGGGLKVWVKVDVSELPNKKNASCAKGGRCKLGDIGPGGGTVFYVSKSFFTSTGSVCDLNCRYLEASPTDLNGRFTWDDAIAAVSSCKGCRQTGWRLPTLDELKVLYRARFTVAGFLRPDLTTPYCNGYWEYWSSTSGESGSRTYYYWNFDSNYGYAYPPYMTKCVRPVRSFG